MFHVKHHPTGNTISVVFGGPGPPGTIHKNRYRNNRCQNTRSKKSPLWNHLDEGTARMLPRTIARIGRCQDCQDCHEITAAKSATFRGAQPTDDSRPTGRPIFRPPRRTPRPSTAHRAVGTDRCQDHGNPNVANWYQSAVSACRPSPRAWVRAPRPPAPRARSHAHRGSAAGCSAPCRSPPGRTGL